MFVSKTDLALYERIAETERLFIDHYRLSIIHCSLLIAHCPLPIAHYPLLITHYSLLITHLSNLKRTPVKSFLLYELNQFQVERM